MCGRYKQTSPLGSLAELYGLAPDTALPAPQGVLAPGMTACVILDGRCAAMRWGFTPAWSKEDLKTKIINARIETLAEKPSFRKARRCLVPADGFFEWDKSKKPAQAYEFQLKSRRPFVFAGLWDEWTDPATGEVRTGFAIVTTAAAGEVAAIHERMPVILCGAEDTGIWLNMEKEVPAHFAGEHLPPPLVAEPVSMGKEKSETEAPRQLSLF
jgi:putative SOS response-associated peptidase YedK